MSEFNESGMGRPTPARDWRAITSVWFFPALFVYLETTFHLVSGSFSLHFVTWLMFAIATGLVASVLTSLGSRRVNLVVAWLITFVGALIFTIQIVAKSTLAQYYQIFSSASLFVDNIGTGDYNGAILEGLLRALPGVILFCLPLLAVSIFGGRMFAEGARKVRAVAMIALVAVVFHVAGVLSLELPWKGDLTPKLLYESNENVDEQVAQLGLIQMVALDARYLVRDAFAAGRDEPGQDDSPAGGLRLRSQCGVPVDSPAAGAEQVAGSDRAVAQDAPNQAAGVAGAGQVVDAAVVAAGVAPVQGSPVAVAGAAQDQVAGVTPSAQSNPYRAQGPANVMNVDFGSRAARASDKDVKWMHEYFASLKPTEKNQYTGLFRGKNVIFFTLEGFSKYAIDPKLTPTLYKLAHEGFVFENFYTPLHYTSTSGGELQNLTGIYPKAGNPISMKEIGVKGLNMYFTLANQLKRIGYHVIGYHNNGDMYGRSKSHPQLGYDWRYAEHGYTMEKNKVGRNVWPQSDLYMIETTIDDYIDSPKPFHVYYLTISAHMPTNFSGNWMSIRNKAAVQNLPYTDVTKAYLAANIEVDKALKYLLDRLEKAGKLKDTVIVMSPDHIPYFDVPTIEELAGKSLGGSKIKQLSESDVDFDLYRSSLIIWSGSMTKPVVVKKICTQVDILPTISNLLGLEYDSRLLAGTDILSNSDPLVIFSSKSWLTDKGLYNSYSGEFKPAPGVSMAADERTAYVSRIKQVVKDKTRASMLIIRENYYNLLFSR